VLGVAEREPDRDEPLLGAVVEIALDPAALDVAGRDDPRAAIASRNCCDVIRQVIP
jgi:hypothetical protein